MRAGALLCTVPFLGLRIVSGMAVSSRYIIQPINVSHICNLIFSATHLKKTERGTGKSNINNIFYLTQIFKIF